MESGFRNIKKIIEYKKGFIREYLKNKKSNLIVFMCQIMNEYILVLFQAQSSDTERNGVKIAKGIQISRP